VAKKKDEAGPEHRTKTTKEKRSLRCELTQTELLAAGETLADLLDSLRCTTAERENVVKQYKAKESELEAKIETQQLLVRNKSEIRMVDCLNVLDYTDVKCIVTRLDTGEVIVDRKLTEDEKQCTIEFDHEPADIKETYANHERENVE
jgi:hypothetical protein